MNYIISEKLLNHAFYLQITGQAWTGIHRTGMNIRNMKESVEDIAGRKELRRIRNIDNTIEGYILKILQL